MTVLIAHPQMFTGFHAYDDEGYMLIALKSFLRHGHLYDDVFTQYGPFYYEFWGAVFSLCGLSVNHDAGRTVTMVAWVLTALLIGLATWRMTRSVLLGAATQILAFVAIGTLVNEPMHPGGLVCLLLGTILVLSCLVRAGTSPMAMGLLGGAVMALILVKVNVGAFALAALALACVVSYPALARPRWLRPGVELAFVAVPCLLISSKLGQAWARDYALHVAAAALAVVIVLRARPGGDRDREELWWLGAGLALMALAVCAAILAAGTSPGGLVEGVIVQPLRQSNAFSLPLFLSHRLYLYDLFALVGAGAYWYGAGGLRRTASPAFAAAVALLSVFIGVEMALSVIGKTILFDATTFLGYPFGFLAFAWVALIPVPGSEDGDTAFARLLLPPLAVLQALHAFPVAGSQVAWSTFLLAPVGALCVANGARGLARLLDGERERRAIWALGAVAALVGMVVLVNTQLRQPLDGARAVYNAATPLDLPGAEQMRLSPEEVETYRGITRAIDVNCPALLTLPGMNSFYLWARMEPPTGFNATGWTTLFDAAHQRRVIEATRSTRHLCLLENDGILAFWEASGESQTAPVLVNYLRRGFRPLQSFGAYELLRREGTAGESS